MREIPCEKRPAKKWVQKNDPQSNKCPTHSVLFVQANSKILVDTSSVQADAALQSERYDTKRLKFTQYLTSLGQIICLSNFGVDLAIDVYFGMCSKVFL